MKAETVALADFHTIKSILNQFFTPPDVCDLMNFHTIKSILNKIV